VSRLFLPENCQEITGIYKCFQTRRQKQGRPNSRPALLFQRGIVISIMRGAVVKII
jgi:hypothetical protein